MPVRIEAVSIQSNILHGFLAAARFVYPMDDREFVVTLNISAMAYQRMYSGDAQHILAQDRHGRRIRFPASSLRPFVTREGISGVFVLRVDARNKLIEIRREPG